MVADQQQKEQVRQVRSVDPSFFLTWTVAVSVRVQRRSHRTVGPTIQYVAVDHDFAALGAALMLLAGKDLSRT